MITCPLCQSLVNKEAPYISTNSIILHLEDNAEDNFYCPTYVKVSPGVRWCHYDRNTAHGCFPIYRAIIPPFHIEWHDGLNSVTVKIMGDNINDYRKYKEIYFGTNIDKVEILNLYKRFSNLKVFT